MTKAEKLRLCDRLLLATAMIMLASSLQLEATGSDGKWWVWLHIIIGCCFFVNIIWHVQLHFGWKSWFERFYKQKSPVTRWLAVFALFTLISAIVAFIHWADSFTHSSLGGLHGKIGFIFLVIAIGHTVKRIKFFRKRQKNHMP